MPRTAEAEESPSARHTVIWRNVLTFLAILGIMIVLGILVLIKSILVLVAISIVFAAGLGPAVAWLERRSLPGGRRFPRGLAILLIYLLGVLIALGAAALIIIPVVAEATRFSRHAPEYLRTFESWLADLHARYSWIPNYASLVDKANAEFRNAGAYLVSSVSTAFGIFGSVISTFSVLVITFYLLASYEDLKRAFLSLIPPKAERKASQVLSDMAAAMGGWLRGMLMLSAIIGGTTAAAMIAIGIPYPFVIGIIGAIGELIPMVGPIAALIAALIIAAFGPTWKLGVVIVFFAFLSLIESNVLAPKIMQRQVGLTPLVTIMALLIGGALLGIVGALLAIPIAAALQVLFGEVIAPAIRKGEGRP